MTVRRRVALIAGRAARYTLRRSDRARRLILQVSRRRGLEVVLPRRWAEAEADTALADHAAWLVRQLDRHQAWDGPERRLLAAGSAVPVLGRARRLELRVLAAGARPRFELDADALTASLPPSAILDPRPALERWLRRLARREFARRIPFFAAAAGASPRRLVVGERTTRWGSCSSWGALSFCWRLVMAPPAVIDAVVAHEVCHLRHLDHGPRFHALLDRICPGHRGAGSWLAEYGETLHLDAAAPAAPGKDVA